MLLPYLTSAIPPVVITEVDPIDVQFTLDITENVQGRMTASDETTDFRMTVSNETTFRYPATRIS